MKIPVIFVSVLSLLAAGAHGQSPQVRKPSDNFSRMFPHPTSTNAFEDFVRAGDILNNSPEWQDYENAASHSPTTLTAKRAILFDRAIQNALAAVRAGLMKPVVSPYTHMNDETILPELSSFRSIARLYNVVEYVHLADSEVRSAIDTLFDALRFGYAIQQGALINGLVAIASDTIVLRQIETHVDQLGSRECSRLVQLASDWVQKPDPAAAIVANEAQSEQNALKKYRGDPMSLGKALYGDDSSDAAISAEQFLANLADHPEQAASAFDQASSQIAAEFAAELENLNLPYWQRKPPTPIPDSSGPGARIANMITPNLNGVTDRYARELAEVQLLGVYAAVVQYRWDHDRLPEGLGELRLGGLEIDPFNGQSFAYRRIDGMRFEVSSVGPLDRGTSDSPPTGLRSEIVIPPRRAK